MRKYMIGAIAGAALMFGIQAGAATVLNGAKVSAVKTVKLNGKDIGQGAIINNSTYLPVRAIANSLSLGIDTNGGTINLTEPEATPAPTPAPAPTPDPTISYTIVDANARIKTIEEQITQCQRIVDGFAKAGMPNDSEAVSAKNAIKSLQDELAIWQQKKAELEALNSERPKVESVYFTSP